LDPRERTSDLQLALGASLDAGRRKSGQRPSGIVKCFNAEKLTCEEAGTSSGRRATGLRNRPKAAWMVLLDPFRIAELALGGWLESWRAAASTHDGNVVVGQNAISVEAHLHGGVQPGGGNTRARQPHEYRVLDVNGDYTFGEAHGPSQ
jgi:GpV Apex motif